MAERDEVPAAPTDEAARVVGARGPAPVIMVQGSMSGVGKSVIAAGLCRILRRRGFRVAPFKAQNMSLNAAVTLHGEEIARSTAVQAAAAGIEPTVDMNPVLLKPEAEMRSQVILRGRVAGTITARDYFGRKRDFWPIVAESLDRLRATYDVIVAEGAGSPAEMNLRDRDIVNMRVARYAGAAALLVGDIDRGGVFAQLIGTLDLLPPEERALVRGLIVNRFWGDPALFQDGVEFIEHRTGLPVFGVVPAVRDIGLAEEDSAVLDSPRNRSRDGSPDQSRADSSDQTLRIAVVRLPCMANFDDFGPLERLAGVELTYVDRPEELTGADLVILPGTKSTIADLAAVRARGLADALVAAHGREVPIMGICGGFQMLGQAIHDPDQVESSAGSIPGLALLPHQTIFEREKQTRQVRGRLEGGIGPFAAARGTEIAGYESHAGRTQAGESLVLTAPIRLIDRAGTSIDELDGALSDDGIVFGTYLHGLFDNQVIRDALVSWLRERRGLTFPVSVVSLPSAPSPDPPVIFRDSTRAVDPHDRWADALEAALDLPLLLARCGISYAREAR